MDPNNRRARRRDLSCAAKLHFLEEDMHLNVSIKDISLTGARCIICGRVVKEGAHLAVAMDIQKKEIMCKGRVAWILAMRPGLGNISVFDVGIEFSQMQEQDREFLKKIIEQDAENA